LTVEEIVAGALERYPNETPTGYSTTNYIVLEYIMETLTGTPMPQLLQELVLDP